MDWSTVGRGTASVWAGEEDTFSDGATQVPLVHSVAFGYQSLDEWSEVALGCEEGHIYSRATNPTVRVFEDKVRMLEGGFEVVRALLPRLKFDHMAAKLGSVSTLAGPPSTTSHVELTVEQRQALGIPESLIRYSVGIENPEDLKSDLEQALARL